MLRKLPDWLSDLLIAGVIGAAAIGDAFTRSGHHWLSVPLTISGTLLLLLRRRYPVQILAAETVLAAALALAGRDWLIPAVIAMVWTVASRLDRRRSLRLSSAAAGTVALAALAALANGQNPGPGWPST